MPDVSFRANSTRERWPACKAPIVGISPIDLCWPLKSINIPLRSDTVELVLIELYVFTKIEEAV